MRALAPYRSSPTRSTRPRPLIAKRVSSALSQCDHKRKDKSSLGDLRTRTTAARIRLHTVSGFKSLIPKGRASPTRNWGCGISIVEGALVRSQNILARNGLIDAGQDSEYMKLGSDGHKSQGGWLYALRENSHPASSWDSPK